MFRVNRSCDKLYCDRGCWIWALITIDTGFYSLSTYNISNCKLQKWLKCYVSYYMQSGLDFKKIFPESWKGLIKMPALARRYRQCKMQCWYLYIDIPLTMLIAVERHMLILVFEAHRLPMSILWYRTYRHRLINVNSFLSIVKFLNGGLADGQCLYCAIDISREVSINTYQHYLGNVHCSLSTQTHFTLNAYTR